MLRSGKCYLSLHCNPPSALPALRPAWANSWRLSSRSDHIFSSSLVDGSLDETLRPTSRRSRSTWSLLRGDRSQHLDVARCSCRGMSCHVISFLCCYDMLCRICYVISCHGKLWHVMLCYGMLCFVMVWLSYVVSHGFQWIWNWFPMFALGVLTVFLRSSYLCFGFPMVFQWLYHACLEW